ncbi:hypothetical protein KC19_1G225400 [Ceratodon purpureus]|uniref:Uncharacterized protein n=1 Tax=Ceratodon purpureus TaxID=3225 RepID=A0A8T0J873_CERPU|nr:hypothetical protein KC19_1G225400 [Ceratodon purpureus]
MRPCRFPEKLTSFTLRKSQLHCLRFLTFINTTPASQTLPSPKPQLHTNHHLRSSSTTTTFTKTTPKQHQNSTTSKTTTPLHETSTSPLPKNQNLQDNPHLKQATQPAKASS